MSPPLIYFLFVIVYTRYIFGPRNKFLAICLLVSGLEEICGCPITAKKEIRVQRMCHKQKTKLIHFSRTPKKDTACCYVNSTCHNEEVRLEKIRV